MDKMFKFLECPVCDRDIFSENFFQIKNVPDATFNFSDKTIDLNIANCNKCGAVFLHNTPLSKDYKIVYRSLRVSSNYRKEKKKQLKKFIEKYNLEDKNIVEVGCGDGQFLEIFKELDAKIVGIETSGSFFEEYTEEFDCFCTFHVLEHYPNPRWFVENLYGTIKPNGIGIIEVPNYDHIEKKNIWLEFTKDHRVYYRERTLIYLLMNSGFDIKEVQYNDNGLCLTVIVRKPDYTDCFVSMQNKMEENIDKFKDLVSAHKGNYAIYGAGHYTQLLLQNVDESLLPKYIFDGNKKKVGGKIRGIFIHYKNNISDIENCDTIIISCGTYNREVYKMLQEMNLNKNLIMWE